MSASTGNFGQAIDVHLPCPRRAPLTVYAAEQTNPLPIARTRPMDARVVLAGEDFDAGAPAREAAVQEGARFVEESRDPEPAAGAGTIAPQVWLAFAERHCPLRPAR